MGKWFSFSGFGTIFIFQPSVALPRVWSGLPHSLTLLLEIPYALFFPFALQSIPADLKQSGA